MLEDISNLGSSDPNVSKAAALSIIQYASQNKGELEYIVKRLVSGMESAKITTRTGCYSTLAALLSFRKVDPFRFFDLIQKALVTNKQNTKKERRLIFIGRILSTGVIFKTCKVAELAKDEEVLKAALKDIVGLSLIKSSYFQLATPFLCHILKDNTLTQETFDSVVWPSLEPLFSTKAVKSEDKEEEEEEDDTELDEFCCRVQLALLCKNGEYKQDFLCLTDVNKIVKAVLGSRVQFVDELLRSLFKHLASGSETEAFWTSLLENIKSTQFDFLCNCVEKAVEEGIPPSCILSKKLITFLLSVFKEDDSDFNAKSRKTIGLLLLWKKGKESSSGMSKKQRKSALKVLFGGDPPNLLHENKHLHAVIRPFLASLGPRDFGHLHEIVSPQLGNPDTGLRMTIVYIQFLGKIATAKNASAETCFEIGKRLLHIALGAEKIEIAVKKSEEDEEDEDNEEENTHDDSENQEQIKGCALDCVHTILSCCYNFEFMNLLSSYVFENVKELTASKETRDVLKQVKKTLRKFDNEHLKYVLSAYGLRVLIDEGKVVSTSQDTVNALMEIAKTTEGEEEEMFSELIKFILSTVLKEPHPAFNYEGMFNRLIIEGEVKEEAVQLLADAIDVQLIQEEGGEEEEDDDEEDDDEVEPANGVDGVESDDEEEESAAPSPKRAKTIDPAVVAKLKESFGAESDSEESIDMDEATEEDLKRMDTALAKVFAVKKSMKEEQEGEVRALMRTFRLVDAYVSRHIKGMPVSALLILLMPVIHSVKNSLKLKKNTELTTKAIGVLDNLNRAKKFTGCDDAVEGTLASMASDLYDMANEKKNKLVRELLEHSVILLTKCFLQKSKHPKKEQKRFIQLYLGAVDTAKSKIKKRKVRKNSSSNSNVSSSKRGGSGGGGGHNNMLFSTSRFVRSALESFPDWKKGTDAILERINA